MWTIQILMTWAVTTLSPFNLAGDPTFAGTMTPGGLYSFENRWALRKAFEFHLLLGKERVQSRIHILNHYLKERLDDIKGIELATPMSDQLSAGFTFSQNSEAGINRGRKNTVRT